MHIDHILYGTPELEMGMEAIANRLGVEPEFGGRHPGIGTHNALVSLGSSAYLEVIAPDPAQAVEPAALPYGLSALRSPRLITWAVRHPDLSSYVKSLQALGIPSACRDRGRTRGDGLRLSWRSTTLPASLVVERRDFTGLIPFAIDWGDTVHPSTTAPGATALRLHALTLHHPARDALDAVARTLKLPAAVRHAPTGGLSALIDTPAGPVELH